jgi:methylated-DNA-[protein]-cysteine S-methyltransferase
MDSMITPTNTREMPPVRIGRLDGSPIGPMWLALTQQGLAMVQWDMPQADFKQQVLSQLHRGVIFDGQSCAEALRQLSAYLHGDLHVFSIPLDLAWTTPFQQQVLGITAQIPYGRTSTYKEIAIRVGKPNAARAVGRVEATNPIPLVIPCHRVLGSDGSLHGYGGPGGIKLKAWLLALENAHI